MDMGIQFKFLLQFSFTTMIEVTNYGLISNTTKTHKKSFLSRNISKYFQEFSSNTSIHGFKYLAAARLCTIEKIWWLIVLGGCFYLCSTLVKCALQKREENPVFISFRQSPMHLWDIPFPAITICPSIKIKASKYNFTLYKQRFLKNNLTQTELQDYLDASIICRCGFDRQEFDHKHMIDHQSFEFLLKNAPTFGDFTELCHTNKDQRNCFDDFSPMLISAGLCYTFNMLDRLELIENITYLPKNHMRHRKSINWNLDTNYLKTLNTTFPLRITSETDGLHLKLIFAKSESDKSCDYYQGFQIFVHHPAELPAMSNKYLLLAPDESYKIWIKPHITTTSGRLLNYYPDKRGCFYSSERKLKFFRIYTEVNCKVECAANYTLRKCGCSPYYLPHENFTRLCGLNDDDCVFKSKEDFLNPDMHYEIFKIKSTGFCDCLPSCTSINYDLDVTPKQHIKTHSNVTNTMVYISFKDRTFLAKERNELFSDVDFLASCGGLLGLFTGFSVVSLAEVIYFLTLKWICNLWNARNRMF